MFCVLRLSFRPPRLAVSFPHRLLLLALLRSSSGRPDVLLCTTRPAAGGVYAHSSARAIVHPRRFFALRSTYLDPSHR
ncbi:hypothetical protein PLICRDRAFT_169719 [Plicaturopsis crispa FD-325 SS-3]|uniref:Secreted protein n=1 Tax=Plicaturopsis crispa FD-325 SS-3 TaxID=944288 RepID=A0A0C9SUU2_PLICR|nr:hypothetical protein PLICRDRAFT_181241 [Plicaturopsis crispa FD-325 SS-3]KII95019.1 hypothetical protein PLICRDRAFT_169719 [Plicaturopsis crispa FD-325 SS-3]